MGTHGNVAIACVSGNEFEDIFYIIVDEILRINNMFNIYNEESDFSLINCQPANKSFPVNNEIFELLLACSELNKKA